MTTSINSNQNSVFMRLWAILRTDAVLRLRRTSTLVLMMIVSYIAYSVLPDPASGRGLFVINGARALYNSASVSFATSMMFSIIGIGLFGYYMVSNTIRRDIDSRVGSILAASPVRSWEYIFGKFLGNISFLTVITVFFMLAMMIIYTIRKEAPLEPLVFLRTYIMMCASATVFVSVVALVFESLPILSGRVGDVLYFFVWLGSLTYPIIAIETTLTARRLTTGATAFPTTLADIPGAAYLDFFGMGTGMASINAQMPAANNGFSIGASPFDPHLAPIILNEATIPGAWLTVKLLSLLGISSVLVIAYLVFHRFDPTKARATIRQSKRNIFAALNTALKPLSKLNTILWDIALRLVGQNSFFMAILGEIFLTLATKPIAILFVLGFNVSALFLPLASVKSVLLPLIGVAFVIIGSDLALRERTRGTTSLIFSLPSVKPHFVWIKMLATSLYALSLVITSFFRLLLNSPSNAISLTIGMIFLAAAAVGLAVASGTAKVFIVCALAFFYLSLNMGGAVPSMDFAGWFGTADTSIQAMYVGLSAGLLAIGYVVHWWRIVK